MLTPQKYPQFFLSARCLQRVIMSSGNDMATLEFVTSTVLKALRAVLPEWGYFTCFVCDSNLMALKKPDRNAEKAGVHLARLKVGGGMQTGRDRRKAQRLKSWTHRKDGDVTRKGGKGGSG